ncbi:hypothetical protein MPSEU_000006000 [Mayamaea pseudoterrestris]|nr:hypothetical protein MPSEU_000006000 [Mayamaea pseudoterrestris]
MHREAEKQTAFRDRLRRPETRKQQSTHDQTRREEKPARIRHTEPLSEHSRPFYTATGACRVERHVKQESIKNGKYIADGHQLLSTSIRKQEETLTVSDRAQRNRKLALKLINCAEKARDHEYEQFLAAQQTFASLDYDVVAGFIESKVKAQALCRPKGSVSSDESLTKNESSQIDMVTVCPSSSYENNISKQTKVAENVMNEHDIRSIRDTLSLIEDRLRDASRSGQKVPRAEMITNLNRVAKLLNVSMEEINGPRVPSRQSVKDAATHQCQQGSFEHVRETNDTSHASSASSLAFSDVVVPSAAVAMPRQRSKAPAIQDENYSDDVSDIDNSEFTKWANELEDDDSREAANFIRELISNFSADSSEYGVIKPIPPANAPEQNVLLQHSNRSSLVPSLHSWTTSKQRAVYTMQESRERSILHDRTPIKSKLRQHRIQSWQRISQGASSQYQQTTNASAAHLLTKHVDGQQGGSVEDNSSWSDSCTSNTIESESDESTVRVEVAGIKDAIIAACMPFMNLEAACGSVDDLIQRMTILQRDASYPRWRPS